LNRQMKKLFTTILLVQLVAAVSHTASAADVTEARPRRRPRLDGIRVTPGRDLYFRGGRPRTKRIVDDENENDKAVGKWS
jgi:hypothetical protein